LRICNYPDSARAGVAPQGYLTCGRPKSRELLKKYRQLRLAARFSGRGCVARGLQPRARDARAILALKVKRTLFVNVFSTLSMKFLYIEQEFYHREHPEK
ncbi:MAG: hypothetical protein U9R05_08820, partial [Chloroflexota bacterium]|nr:hypothetical protein [Chloroflexota bacterium]